jgi:hypothetical protein
MSRFLRVNGVWKDGAGNLLPVAPLQGFVYLGRPVGIPMEIAEEAYKEYAAQYGTSQSLARLNERGGFDAAELASLLFDRIKRIERSAHSAPGASDGT